MRLLVSSCVSKQPQLLVVRNMMGGIDDNFESARRRLRSESVQRLGGVTNRRDTYSAFANSGVRVHKLAVLVDGLCGVSFHVRGVNAIAERISRNAAAACHDEPKLLPAGQIVPVSEPIAQIQAGERRVSGVIIVRQSTI